MQALCVNAAVAGLASSERINEACLELQASPKKRAGPAKASPVASLAAILDLLLWAAFCTLLQRSPTLALQGKAQSCGCPFLQGADLSKAERFQVQPPACSCLRRPQLMLHASNCHNAAPAQLTLHSGTTHSLPMPHEAAAASLAARRRRCWASPWTLRSWPGKAGPRGCVPTTPHALPRPKHASCCCPTVPCCPRQALPEPCQRCAAQH